jgi:hypothetical protein
VRLADAIAEEGLNMEYGFVIGSIVCCWAMLRVLGNHRLRTLESMKQDYFSRVAAAKSETPDK